MPKVSIIIPFNNVEHYIKECLESVVNQTLKDIEIIMINDASNDNTADVVKEYMQKDNRIKLLELPERKGQGYARNRGIEIAQGEYIGFVDSDDFIKLEMFEVLYNKAKENNTDITMCLTEEYDDVEGKYINTDYYSLEVLKDFKDSVFSAEETKDKILDINVGLWNKLYKREYLEQIGEKFPEGFIYEDLPFFYGTYIPAQRVQVVWEVYYYYRVNRKMSTMQQTNRKILDRLPMVALTYEKVKNVEYLQEMLKQIKAWIINDIFHRYTLLTESYQKEYFFAMKKLFKNLEIDEEDKFWKKVYHYEGYLLVMNNKFEDFNQKVFNYYLDLHKMEDRLFAHVNGMEEIVYINIDKKLKHVYGEITKTYNATDEKVSGVYEEITRNYKYTENLTEKVRNEINDKYDNKIANLYDALTKNYEYTNEQTERMSDKLKQDIASETDNKIHAVYDEISKNYDYTNEQAEKISNDLKQDIITDIDNKIHSVYDEISKNYEFTKELNTKQTEQFGQITEEIKNNNIQEISKIYEKVEVAKTETKKDIDNLLSEYKDKIWQNMIDSQTRILTGLEQKISPIYQEITNNYKYTEDLIYKRTKDITEEIEQTLKKASDKVDDIGIQLNANLDEKIKLKSEETKNEILNIYDKMAEAFDSSKNEVETLKTEIISKYGSIENNIREKLLEVNNVQEDFGRQIYMFEEKYKRDISIRLNEVYSYANDEIVKIYKQIKENNDELLKSLELKGYEINKQTQEVRKQIEDTQRQVDNKVNYERSDERYYELLNKIKETEDNRNNEIAYLKSEFEDKLNQQRIKYERKLISMENKIKEAEEREKENKKGFFEKILGVRKKR